MIDWPVFRSASPQLSMATVSFGDLVFVWEADRLHGRYYVLSLSHAAVLTVCLSPKSLNLATIGLFYTMLVRLDPMSSVNFHQGSCVFDF